MKVCHLSKWDTVGGAARGANKVHQALLHAGAESAMRVHIKASDDWHVIGPRSDRERYYNQIKPALSRMVGRLQRDPVGSPRKGCWFPSRLSRAFNSSDIDVVNLHWISEETISMRDLHRINKPLVWRLPDMWPFCGTEHYTEEGPEARWKVGYRRDNRPKGARGPDLDRWLWLAKQRAYDRQLSIVAPSPWMANCARQSALLRDKPIRIIPNPLDLAVFKPLDQAFCRKALGWPTEAKILTFGAVGGNQNHRKGFDLLARALEQLRTLDPKAKIHCCVFGQSQPERPVDLPFSVTWAGAFNDDVALAMVYSASDLFISPARQEGYANTCAEAAACGCPSLGFAGTGAEATIDHRITGYLARMEDADDLTAGIQFGLAANADGALSRAAREKALQEWHFDVVADAYLKLYDDAARDFAAASKDSSIRGRK